ncbi:hypothetical protein [Sphingobium sp. DC-2]|uniref:hypothetical protein n=1 Tax=Sphingobium sp. DC-2 TaxID=1303256 RepID=UPI0004C2C43C|nr:hypothetical protein [Sphingobium sp. DC-2]
MDKKELIALADKLSEVKVESHDMFMSAFHLAFPAPSQIWEDEEREEWTADYEKWHQLGWTFANFLDASAYLNAAMLLVPEGWEWQADTLKIGAERDKHAWFRLHRPDYGEQFEAEAATPALALCAAAIRAIASQEGE